GATAGLLSRRPDAPLPPKTAQCRQIPPRPHSEQTGYDMGETIKLKAKDGVTISAYKASPGGKPKGGMVVFQEIFGVNHHIRNVADRYAALGYLAIAPGIFDRVEPNVE